MVKCCDIHAGKLNAQIVIERKTRSADGMGGSADTWATEATVWAWWRGVSGSESWQAMRVSPQNRFRAVIRFKGDANDAPYYTAEDRVAYRGRAYAIESVMDMEDRQEWLELVMVEGGKS